MFRDEGVLDELATGGHIVAFVASSNDLSTSEAEVDQAKLLVDLVQNMASLDIDEGAIAAQESVEQQRDLSESLIQDKCDQLLVFGIEELAKRASSVVLNHPDVELALAAEVGVAIDLAKVLFG